MWRYQGKELKRAWNRIRTCCTSEQYTNSEGNNTYSTFGILALFGMSLYIVDNQFFSITTCVGPSMLPTFRADGDVVIVKKVPPDSYQVGDVVICESKSNPHKTVCKRIGGKSGDFVVLRNYGEYHLFQIPIDHVWILGDNPANSHDSRHYGPVPEKYLRGRVTYKIRLLEFPNIVQKIENVKPPLIDFP